MTSEQYARWRDFALRMARVCHRRNVRVREHVEDFIDRYRDEPERVSDWDGVYGKTDCIASEIDVYLFDCGLGRDVDDDGPKFKVTGTHIACCVRAGLDMASDPSGGVVGYTVGDLRRMYPEGLPGWLLAAFGPKAARALKNAKAGDGVWL